MYSLSPRRRLVWDKNVGEQASFDRSSLTIVIDALIIHSAHYMKLGHSATLVSKAVKYLAQHCCNDCQQSQWENGDFDPCRSETRKNFTTNTGLDWIE